MTNPTPLSDRTYMIGSGAVTDTLGAFTPSVAYCPLSYALSFIIPSLPPNDPSAITFDGLSRTIEIESYQPASAGTYIVEIAVRFLTTDLMFYSYAVTLVDSCSTTTITISDDLLDTLDIDFVVWDDYSWTLSDTHVSSSAEPTVSCP